MLPPLTIIPAGAGSGKTYSIQQRLGQWVVDGEVAPERIVAVTFTEAAAAELRERIRAKLLGLGRLDDALKLDQAYISTIHGFGLRVLTEFAFDSGLSPKPRLLNADEENTLIRLALARTDKANIITSNLSDFGYGFDFNAKKSAEEVFRDDLLRVVSRLRSVGWKEGDTGYEEHAVGWIKERYGKIVSDEKEHGEKQTEKLLGRIERLLQIFPEGIARKYGVNPTCETALKNDFRNFQKALKSNELATDWKLWQDLRSLRQSKRGSPLPDEYDELTSAIIDAANVLPKHPGPLTHANTHIEALLAAGQDVLVHYAHAKREAGLVDYSDMIAMAGEILRERLDVLNTLAGRIDCLIVDEFQDTNPLQFALLWQLKEAGVPTVIVGDLKQAIMDFQGADPRLFAALAQQNQQESEPLIHNWRSQPRLMEFVNALGPGLFGDAYVSLDPQSNDSELKPLEVVTFSKKAKKGQHAIRAAFVGQRLKELLEDHNHKIIDRRTGEKRQLRGGDIAILCPTHKMLTQYATIFRNLGLRVRLQEEGWFGSRVVQIAWYALAYIANPADRHAALYLAVTELGSLRLEDALRQLMDEGHIHEPLLEKLDSLAPGVSDRTVYALVADVFSALDIFNTVSVWPNGEQARANLLRLQAEAGEFMEANREAMAHGGFHGSGVQSFLAWLDVKVEGKDKDNQPDPRVLDEDAIELVTWHSSKGREWPVVAVCGMDRVISAKLPKMDLGYSSFDDLSCLLENAQIEYSPKFAAPETNDKFLTDLQAESETGARRLLYVAMTRARDKLILEWPGYLTGGKTLTYWSILSQEAGLSLDTSAWKIGETSFPCLVTKGGSEMPEGLDLGDSSFVSKHAVNKISTIGRRAIRHGSVPEKLTPDNVTPSTMGASNIAESCSKLSVKNSSEPFVESYGDKVEVEVGLSGAALGTFLHRCFEVLGAKPKLIDRLPTITGVEMDEQAVRNITASVKSFEDWLNQYFSVESVSRELPLLALDDNGSVVSGIADLVVETSEGLWVIDHKSDRVDDPGAVFKKYQTQLESYARLLNSESHGSTAATVVGVGINWIRRGEVMLMKI